MEEKDILMILPRRTIVRRPCFENSFRLERPQKGKVIAFLEEEKIGQALWEDAFDFEGLVRPILIFECAKKEYELDLFEGLISTLALDFDAIPGRYPLYIKLKETNLPYIAKASRMGFVPYFGAWLQSSAQDSEATWQNITEALRQAYPQGFQENIRIEKNNVK